LNFYMWRLFREFQTLECFPFILFHNRII
jgi:hypothetical protein